MNNPDPWGRAAEKQMTSALKMLGTVLRNCPPDLWQAQVWTDPEHPESKWTTFWSIAFHTLFYADLYMEGSLEKFSPPAPFGLEELDPKGIVSDRPYTQQELLGYLEYCLDKCRAIFSNLTADKAAGICRFPWMELAYADLLLDDLRHIQEHTAQLSLFLGQQRGLKTKWISGKESD
jgi:hypothetical protein